MEGERERRGREKGGEEREGEKGGKGGQERERGGGGKERGGRRGKGGGGQGEGGGGQREGGRREGGREGVICDNACRRIKWTVFFFVLLFSEWILLLFFFCCFFFFFNLSQFLSYRIFTASQAFIFCMCEFSILISQLCTLFLTTPVEFHTLLCDEG